MTSKSRKIAVIGVFGMVCLCYGLTNGPSQPEFTSFEPVDVTDMVNLPTGDFTYVLPLGEVKGPAGVGYPVELNYHAGVRNEQEATWTGLGWNLEAGAINRTIEGFADDNYNGKTTSFLHDPGESYHEYGLSVGWCGFNINFGWNEKGFQGVTGIGLEVNAGPASIGFSIDPMTGQANGSMGFSFGGNWGSVGLGADFGSNGISLSGGYSKFGVKLNGGVAFGNNMQPSYFGSVGLKCIGTSLNLSSKGMSISAGGASFGSEQSQNFTSGGSFSYQESFSFAIPIPPLGLTIGYSESYGGWHYSELTEKGTYGYLYHSAHQKLEVDSYNKLLSHYVAANGGSAGWNYADFAVPSGSLSKTMATTASTPDVSTIVNYVDGNPKLEYVKLDDFSLPAQDNYTVASQGLIGAFKPIAYNAVHAISCNDLDNDGDYFKMSSSTVSGDAINSNTWKMSPNFSDGMVFKMLGEPNYNVVDNPNVSGYTDDNQKYMVDQVSNTAGRAYGTRIEPIFGLNGIPTKLDGFIITDTKGTTYYYTMALRSVQYIMFENDQQAYPATLGENSTYKNVFDNEPYALTWLLTAITGPDYVKRNFSESGLSVSEKLMPREGDFGYWVRFRYAYDGSNDKVVYPWRNPYSGYIKKQNIINDPGATGCYNSWSSGSTGCFKNKIMYSASLGKKEISYLKSIETPCEVAYFSTSDRLDGKGVNPSDWPSSSIPNAVEGKIEQMQTPTNEDPGATQVMWHSSGPFCISVLADGMDQTWFNQFTSQDNSIASFTYYFIPSSYPGQVVKVELPLYKWMGSGTTGPGRIYVTSVTFANVSGHTRMYLHANLSTTYSYFKDVAVVSGTPSDLNARTDGIWLAKPLLTDLSSFHPVSKKLDKISWYSKTVYPTITGASDPSSAGAIAYRDVTLNYDYQLAKNTPNSSAPGNKPGEIGQGRLTLKSVQFGGTQDGTYMQLPAYLFGYQNTYTNSQGNQDSIYNGPQDSDPWGFKDPGNFVSYENGDVEPSLSMAQRGVLWNLNKITLPSGGSIDIAYERDAVNSSAATMYGISKCDEYKLRQIEGQWLDASTSNSFGIATESDGYYNISGNVSTLITNKTRTIPVTPIGEAVGKDLSRCLNCMCYFFRDSWYYTTFYKIIAVDPVAGTFTLDRELFDDTKLQKSDGTPLGKSLPTTGKLYVLTSIPGTLGDLRVTSLKQNSIAGSITTAYKYAPGVVESLPDDAMPYVKFGDIVQGFMNQINKYSKSDYSVSYPWVEVSIVNSPTDLTQVAGKTKYSFFTYDDKLKLQGRTDSTPVITEYQYSKTVNGSSISVDTITDRSTIIGQVKSIEVYDNANKLKKRTVNHYLFSDELARNAKVVYADLNNPLDDSKPLGAMVEHSVREEKAKSAFTYSLKSITRVFTPHAFLAGVTETFDNVSNTVSNGYFDAATGDPIVTIKENSASGGTSQKRLDVNIPYYYNASSNEQNLMTTKNLNTFSGMTAVLDITGLSGISKVAHSDRLYTDIFNISSIGSIFNTTSGLLFSTPSLIKKAGFSECNIDNFSTGCPYDQSRLWQARTYVLKDNSALSCIPASGSVSGEWLKNTELLVEDKFSRPLAEVVPRNGLAMDTSCVIYHPRMNCIEAAVNNASYDECAAYTCDYDQQENGSYLDYENGWIKNSAALSTNGSVPNHFSNRCVVISLANGATSWGPGRFIRVRPGKDYIMSAWVRVAGGTLTMGGNYQKITNNSIPFTTNNATAKAISTPAPVVTSGNWQYVQWRINTATNGDLSATDWGMSSGVPTQDWGLGLYIGAPSGSSVNAAIDDIRIYPANAIMTTYYYDQNLGVPVTFVDANNNARYNNFDAFGRLTDIYNNAKTWLKHASYNMGGFNGLINMSSLNGPFVLGSPVNLQWTSYGSTISKVTLSYSADGVNWTNIPDAINITNNGSFAWNTPADGSLIAKTNYWIKVEAANQSGIAPGILNSPIQFVNPRHFILWYILTLF